MSDSGLKSQELGRGNPATGCSGEQLGDISRAFVQVYKDCYGKGPTDARTYLAGDLVVCLLQGGFLRGEKTLRDAGRGEAVSDTREAVQAVMRQRLIDTIEDVTDRKVITFISGVDVQTETNAELFVLEPLELETRGERQAIGVWAEQTRPQSRALREDQIGLLAETGAPVRAEREVPSKHGAGQRAARSVSPAERVTQASPPVGPRLSHPAATRAPAPSGTSPRRGGTTSAPIQRERTS